MRAIVLALVTFPGLALAQTASTVAQQAIDKTYSCLNETAARATVKRVDASTMRLVLDGACQSEQSLALGLVEKALDEATPAGLSFDPGPTKTRTILEFKRGFDDRRSQLITSYVMGD